MNSLLRRLAWWYLFGRGDDEFPQVAHMKLDQFGTFYVDHYSRPNR